MTSKPSPRLVTYNGLPVIVIDDRAWMPEQVRAAYPLYDRRAILDEHAAARDAAAENKGPVAK